MKINPYLHFKGNCAEAIALYEKVLGAKTVMKLTYADSPMAKDFPPETGSLIMHARLEIGDYVIMASDAPCDRYQQPQGLSVSLNVKEPAEAERIYKALSENGQVFMPLEETFWAKRFAMFSDRFGTPWMINCEKESF